MHGELWEGGEEEARKGKEEMGGKGRGGIYIYYRKEKAGLTAKNLYMLMNTRS